MPIPVITNFSINDTVPFDSRLVATSSVDMNNMLYPYEGLTIYRTDTKLNYTYNGNTWAVSSNGIYGGDGSLSDSNTAVGFGTVSGAVNDLSNALSFRAFSDNTGNNFVDIKNEFVRNESAIDVTRLSYRSQFRFTESAGSSYLDGPYITYNPKSSSSIVGGISLGTYNEDQGSAYDRIFIEGGSDGLTKFFVDPTPGLSSKTVNIGRNLTTNIPFIGYDWYGEDMAGTGSCFIEFENDQLTLYSYNLNTNLHKTAVFASSFISFNKNVTLTGNFNFSGNLNGTGVTFYIGKGTNGFYITNQSVAFTFGNQRIGYYNAQSLYLEKNILVQYPGILTNTSNLPYFYLGIKGKIVDRKFNPNPRIPFENDLDFSYSTGNRIDRTGNTATFPSNTICIYQQVSGDRTDGYPAQDTRFRIAAKGYTSNLSSTVNPPAFVEYVLQPRDYDRIIYFYSDSLTFHIAHRLSWYLGYPSATDEQNGDSIPSQWKKVGVVETGNTDNINTSNLIVTTLGNGIGYPTNGSGQPTFASLTYQIRTYSQMVIVPSGSSLKIRLDFPYSWNSTIVDQMLTTLSTDFWGYCQSLVFVSQRIGEYNLSQTEIDIRTKDTGINTTTSRRRGTDYQFPYEWVNRSTGLQKWGV